MAYSLQIELISGSEGASDTGNLNYGVLFDEATPQHTMNGVVIGRITNMDPGVTNITFRDTGNGTVGDAGGRYDIINTTINGVAGWYIVVKPTTGTPVLFNYEGTRVHNIYINAYAGSTLIGEGDYTVTMRNLNEAPTDITFTNVQTVTAGQGEANVVKATWAADPDASSGFRVNGYGFLVNGNVVTTDGGFSIDATGQITTNGNFATVEVAGTRTLQVVTYTITSGVPDHNVRYVEAHDVTIAAAANTPPSNVRWSTGGAVAENSGTDATVGMVAADDDGGAAGLRYSIGANANFDIDAATGRIFVKNGAVLNYEGTNTYTVAVTATDTNGSGLSTTQNLTITLTDVNEAPTDLTFGTQQTVQAGATQSGANVIQATWVDPDGAASGFLNNKYAFLVGGNLVLTDGKFTINETTGQVTTNAAITAADVGTKTLQVVAYDAGNNALRYVEAKDITIAAAGDTPSTLGGVPASDSTIATIKDTATTSPFSNVTITDDGNVIVLVSLDNNAKGTLAGGGFAWSAADNAYKFEGSPGDAQVAIRALVFTPTARPNGEVDAAEDTRFNIWVSDNAHPPVTNNKIIVRSEVENRAPTLVAAAYNPTIVHDQNTNLVNPFKDVSIGESNANDNVTVTIKLDDFAKGELKNLSTFVRDDVARTYTFIGSAAAAQVAIRALQYDPRDRAGQAASEVTTFTITVKDDHQAQVSSSNIKVTSFGTNNAPTGLTLNGGTSASVQEYAVPGATEVGVLSATDANGDALTYTLLDNAGGRFAIVGTKIMLAGTGVNFEEAASHQIKVEASDGKGGKTEQVFTINVVDQTTLNKRGTKKSDKLNGTVQDDILKGGSGNVKDTIKGLAGDDKLYGEGGNDSILGGDGIDSLYGGAGNDTLKGEAGKDLLKGDAGNDKAYGGLGNDMLYGGAGNDILKGDADNDVLFGEAGNDKLYGGAGNDTFVFNKKASKTTNFDRIYDFKSGQDKLFLDNAVFKKLGKLGTFDAPAKLDVSMFKTGRAKDKNDYLVYKSGVLYYDADGSGKGAAVEIVKLSGLKVTDIFVI